jgi:hypothetical protein
MIRKVFIIWLAALAISVSCKKDCIKYLDYKVNNFNFSSNSNNLGLFTTDIRNSGDTIRSIRNQFYFEPVKDFLAMGLSLPAISFMNTAYAKESCAEVERSLTSFDPLKTEFSVDAAIDLSAFGLIGVIPANTNLLSIQEVRDRFLAEIQNNDDLHNGQATPVTVDKDFLKYFNGQARIFSLKLVSTTGNVLTNSASVVADINA